MHNRSTISRLKRQITVGYVTAIQFLPTIFLDVSMIDFIITFTVFSFTANLVRLS